MEIRPDWFPPGRGHDPPDADLARGSARPSSVRSWQLSQRLMALGYLLVGTCLGLLLLPVHPLPPRAVPSLQGGVEIAVTTTAGGPTCGHPSEVFKQLGLPQDRVPARAQLLQLPHPDPKRSLQQGGVTLTYDPGKDQLCTLGWQPLWTRFVQGPPTGGTTSTTTQTTTGSSSWLPGSSWVQSVIADLVHSCLQSLSTLLTGIIDWATAFGFMFVTPKNLTYGQTIVISLYHWVLGIADAAVTLVLVIGGYGYMTGRRSDFRETAVRLIVAGIAANSSLFFLTQIIELHNTLCMGLEGALATAGVHLSFPAEVIANLPGAAIYELITYVSELVVALLLVIQMLARIALLDLLIILAPLGCLCFALPQTHAWARLWVQAFVSTLLVQWFQLICIGMGSVLLAGTVQSTWQLGTGSGQPDFSFSIITFLVAIVAYLLAFKLPGMLLSHVLRAGVGDINQTVVKLITGAATFGKL